MGECKPNTQIFRELAAAVGFTETCFSDSDERLARTAFGDQVSFDTLLAKGYAELPIPDEPFTAGCFPTPSGKCEFFSQRLEDEGGEGLPDYLTNYEPPGSSTKYPLDMISPPSRNFLNATFVNVISLRDIEREPLLEMHAQDAAARGLIHGQQVRVFNDRGNYHCRLEISARAGPGVVNGLGIWWRKMSADGRNINELISQRHSDLGRAPTFYDCLVAVEASHKN
jgi:anaerobic selenocysteine-containing dehydrogenase